MNREERRKLNKISEKKMYKTIRKNVQSIDIILDKAETVAKKVSGNIAQVKVPQSVRKVFQKSAEIMESFYNAIPMVNKTFLDDEDDKKCVVNALAMPKYRKRVYECTNEAVKSKNNGVQGTFDYMMLHDLSANRTEVRRTLETLEKTLPVMINGLKANDISTIQELQILLVILERRIYHLYCLYGYYLNDIGKLEEYNIMYQFFTMFDSAFENLVAIK